MGLQNGTDRKCLQIIPEELYDDSMAAKAEQVYQETGKKVTYILGRMEVRGARGSIFYAKGAKIEDRIIVQANNTQFTAEQIADHEAYHGMADPVNYGQLLNDSIVDRITETFSREEFDQVLNKYIAALSGVYDLKSARDGYEYEQRVKDIVEELLADAHAGMNMWDAGATQFTETVNQILDEKSIFPGNQGRRTAQSSLQAHLKRNIRFPISAAHVRTMEKELFWTQICLTA